MLFDYYLLFFILLSTFMNSSHVSFCFPVLQVFVVLFIVIKIIKFIKFSVFVTILNDFEKSLTKFQRCEP
jgi:hypothetical protein